MEARRKRDDRGGAGRRVWLAHAVAFVAMALLSLASVQSILMQAADDSPFAGWPICSSGGPAQSVPQTPADKAAHAACGFCAAASQAPLLSTAPDVATPASVVWTPRPALASLGPRGPPRFRPRARAPPALLLTV
ncbi:MAG: DUF2946 family protein [Caulobacteraceae bacterium]